MLFLNFGDQARAAAFQQKRLAQGFSDTVIKKFDVPTAYVDSLRQRAVPEDLAKLLPGRPLVVDVTKARDQFGLRPEHLPELMRNIIPGSGRVGM